MNSCVDCVVERVCIFVSVMQIAAKYSVECMWMPFAFPNMFKLLQHVLSFTCMWKLIVAVSPSPFSLHPWPVISCCCVKKQIKNIIPLTHFLLSGLLTNRPTTRHERQGDYINRADDPNSKRSEAKTLTTA